MRVAIRDVLQSDAEAICAIYNHHVRHTIVTFEERDVTTDEMRGRIANMSAILPWLVAEREGEIVGYVYAARFFDRSGYRFCAMSTIYMHDKAQRAGIGFSLYMNLLQRLREKSMRSAVGIIALPNPGSIALHEKCGFIKAGHLTEAGFKFGRWIDVGYWQVLLQR
jgi:L-amino acid N-acyltransferase YncA